MRNVSDGKEYLWLKKGKWMERGSKEVICDHADTIHLLNQAGVPLAQLNWDGTGIEASAKDLVNSTY